MHKVFFFSYSEPVNAMEGLRRLLAKSGLEAMIPGGESVAIKLHMGELGNIRHIRPILVRSVVDIVKSRNGKPFLFDTVVNYPSHRDTKEKYIDTAAKHGFTEATMGVPVVIADDADELRAIPIRNRIDGCQLTEIKVPSLLLRSPCIIVLSHVKGHDLAGLGGALKNLAMGCVSKESKRAQHLVNMPVFREEADCDGCGKCVDVCPVDALRLANGKPEKVVAECSSCGSCLFACPSQCWIWPPGSKERLQLYMGHSASAVLSEYHGKIAFLNFIQDVTPHCDCTAASGRPVVQDVGITLAFDPVAIDKASLDLIDQAPIVKSSTTESPPDILGKIHHTSSLVQLQTAEKLGIGAPEYELVRV